MLLDVHNDTPFEAAMRGPIAAVPMVLETSILVYIARPKSLPPLARMLNWKVRLFPVAREYRTIELTLEDTTSSVGIRQHTFLWKTRNGMYILDTGAGYEICSLYALESKLTSTQLALLKATVNHEKKALLKLREEQAEMFLARVRGEADTS